ncbi:MAG: phage minor head protein [Aeromonas veronii]
MNIKSILPRSKQYPTGQNPRIKAFYGELRRRLRRSYKAAAEYAATIKPNLTVNRTVYEYQLDPLLMSQINSYIEALLNEIIYGNAQGEWSAGWWANAYASGAYQQAAEQVAAQTQLLAADAGVTQELPSLQYLRAEAVVMEPGFQRRIGSVYARLFEDMKGFTDVDKRNMAGIITRGMAAGQSPRAIAREMEKKGLEQDWRCLRIASTEVNQAYRQGSWDETDAVNDEVFGDSDYMMKVIHLSALLPTTRRDHAARHGTICTPTEEREWFATKASGGQINCKCSTIDILVNRKTGKPMNTKLRDILLEQKKSWTPEKV